MSKTDAIVQLLKKHSELENQKILMVDYSFDTNGQGYNLRNYEYEGMARIAYGKETNTLMMSYYGGNRHTFEPSFKITISQTIHPISYMLKMRYVFLKYLCHMDDKADRLVDGLYIFEITNMQSVNGEYL